MKADAYRYAIGDGDSPEMVLLGYLDKYGPQAVMGRALYAHEIRCMTVASNIVNAYRARNNSSNWAGWARENPVLADLLAEAETLANG